MGELVKPQVFRKWQAVLNNHRCVQRVVELRQEARKLFPPVTAQMQITYEEILRDIHMLDILTNYLLDINYTEPAESDSKPIDVAMPPDPEGAA